ncbi:MAG: hypothetical protein PVF27_02020 [Gemmatimonadales bacterium]|jgi:hypothetical protein
MMRRGALLALALASAPSLTAQQVTLRFRPVDAMRIRRVFQVHTRVAQSGVPSASRELAFLGGMTQVVTAGPGGDPVVHLSFDSLRTRTRAGRGPWRESPTAGGDTLWAQVRYDERMRVDRSTRPGQGSADLLTTLVTGLPGFAHPSDPVAPAASWRVHVPVGTAADEPAAGRALRVPTTITLDSVVVRARDTLAYLSVAGALSPTVRASRSGQVRVAATVGGALVWSTAWGNMVSAAVRLSIATAPVPPGDPATGALTWERTIRTTVLP